MSDEPLSAADLRSAAVRGLRWTVISRPACEIVLFGSMIVLARLVAPAEFGRYAVALVVTQLLVVPSAGVGTALVQRPKGGERGYVETGFAMCLIIAAVLSVLTFLAAELIVAPVWGSRTAELVLFLGLAIPMSAPSTVCASLLSRRLAFRRLNVVQLVSTIVSAAGQVGLALAGLNAMALVLGGLAGGLVGTIMMWIFAPLPLPRLRLPIARDLWSYGWAAALAAISWAGFNNCDYAIVGARLGAAQAGFYFRAYTLGVEYQRKISQVLPTMGFPLLARAGGADDRDALFRRMVRLMTLIVFPGLAFLAILAPVVIPIVYGPQWLAAIGPTQIIVVAGAATIVIDAGGAALMASGRSRPLMGFGWSHFAVYATAVFIVAPLGIEAVAAAAVVVHSTFMVVSYATVLCHSDHGPVKKVVHALNYLVHDLGPSLVGCAALAGAALSVQIIASDAGAPRFIRVATMVAAGLIAYLGALRVVYPGSFQSLRKIVVHVLPKRSLPRLGRRLTPAAPPGS